MNVRFSGNRELGERYRHHAVRQMDILRGSMDGKDIDQRFLKFDNGVVVRCLICHGTETAFIYHPEAPKAIVPKKIFGPWEPFAHLGDQLERFHRWNYRTWSYTYNAFDHTVPDCKETWPNWSSWNYNYNIPACYVVAVWWGHKDIEGIEEKSDDPHDLKYLGLYYQYDGVEFKNEAGDKEVSGVFSYDHTSESWALDHSNYGFDLQWYSYDVGPTSNQSYYNDFYQADEEYDAALPVVVTDDEGEKELWMVLKLFAETTTTEPTEVYSFICMDLIFGGAPSASDQIHVFFFDIGGHVNDTRYDHGLLGPDYRYGSPLNINNSHRHLEYMNTKDDGDLKILEINLATLPDMDRTWNIDFVRFLGSSIRKDADLKFEIDFIDFVYKQVT